MDELLMLNSITTVPKTLQAAMALMWS